MSHESGKQFKKNAHTWMITCPKHAAALLKLKPSHVELCKTGKEWNIKRKEDGSEQFYHSPKGAMEEANQWFQTLHLNSVDTFVIYGVGLGYAFQAARDWLNAEKGRTLIFLEDDLEVIYCLFQTEWGKDLIHHRQVRLYFFEKNFDFEMKDSGLYSIPLFYFLGSVAFSALSYYAERYQNFLPILEKQIEYIKNFKGYQMMEYMDYGETFFQNFYRNVFQLPYASLAEKLYGQFKGIPAIICGAGPSLEKNLGILEQLGQKALILAGGSALNTVSVNGFLPHLAVSIDPNWNQYARLFMNQTFEVPFFYRNRIFPQVLSLFHDGRLYVPGSGGHKVAEYFEEKLKMSAKENIPEGNNVLNFSLSIAEALGCNPIILVGLDLAYTNDRSYAPGIKPHPILNADKQVATRGSREEVVSKKDIFGNSVKTLWKWISESMWVTKFALTRSQKKIINATEGGIGFDGIPTQALKDVSEEYLTKPFDFRVYVHGEIQNASVTNNVAKEDIAICLSALRASLERCKELCALLRNEFTNVLQGIQKTSQVPSNIVTDRALEALKGLNQEDAYQYILNEFNNSFLSFFGEKQENVKLEQESPDEAKLNLTKKRVAMNQRRYAFLKTVCQANLDTMQGAIEAEKLSKLVSNAFSQQIEKSNSAVAKTEEDKSLHSIYEKGEKTFRIHDAQLNIDYEETLQTSPEVALDASESLLDKIPKNGCYKINYSSGKLKMEHYYQDGKLHGPTSYYAESGALLGRSWFVEGKKQGKTLLYYGNGELYGICRDIDGKPHGVQEYFYQGGMKKSRLEYKNGLVDGTVTLYYSDGFRKREIRFHQGKRHGLEMVWNIGGIKEFEGSYQHDTPIGTFRSWYPFGNIAREITYDHNGTVCAIKGWDFDGSLLPSEAIMRKDYFDLMHEETTRLTDSLEDAYKEIETMTSTAAKGETGPFLDFSDDLFELRKEMENLKSINAELGGELDIETSETVEALWKNPATRRMIGEQINDATKRINQDMKQLEEVMRMTADVLEKKQHGKDSSQEKNQ